MTIIGITGGIGHGKSSLAEAFREIEPRSIHLETFAVISEVIEAWQARSDAVPNPHKLDAVNNWIQELPDVLRDIVHEIPAKESLRFDEEDIARQPELYDKLFSYLQTAKKNPSLFHTRITEANKAEFRPLLQWLGGYLVLRVDKGIWYQELIRRSQTAAADGTELSIISGVRFPTDAQIIRDHGGYIVLIKRPLVGDQFVSDPTERERSKINPDTTILNNAGLTELEAVARRVYTDISLGRLQNRYAATGE